MVGKILLYIEESEQSEGLANKIGVFQIRLGGLDGVVIPGKVCIFYPYLSSETVFLDLKLTRDCYINMTISFS